VNITIDDVNNRLKVLQAELEETLSKANAISGAIQESEYWLDKLNKEEEPINKDSLG
jgi:peptidoglycan hydrolase CwlO-like protein